MLVFAALVLAGLSQRATAAVKNRCLPMGAKTVAKSTGGRAYELKGALWACRFATGETEKLAAATDRWFPAPAVDWAGPRVAHAAAFFDAPGGGGVDILVQDFSLPPKFGSNAPPVLTISLRVDKKVGSLRINRTGGVAWIECPPRGRYSETEGYGDPRPNCTRPGRSLNTVYKHDSGDPEQAREALDSGRTIDPRSLRLRGSTLTWRKAGKRRTAILK